MQPIGVYDPVTFRTHHAIVDVRPNEVAVMKHDALFEQWERWKWNAKEVSKNVRTTIA
jgi:hypothetical protein